MAARHHGMDYSKQNVTASRRNCATCSVVTGDAKTSAVLSQPTDATAGGCKPGNGRCSLVTATRRPRVTGGRPGLDMVRWGVVSRLSGSLHPAVSGRVALSSRHRGCSIVLQQVWVVCEIDVCIA
jgi:hypothetical protein